MQHPQYHVPNQQPYPKALSFSLIVWILGHVGISLVAFGGFFGYGFLMYAFDPHGKAPMYVINLLLLLYLVVVMAVIAWHQSIALTSGSYYVRHWGKTRIGYGSLGIAMIFLFTSAHKNPTSFMLATGAFWIGAGIVQAWVLSQRRGQPSGLWLLAGVSAAIVETLPMVINQGTPSFLLGASTYVIVTGIIAKLKHPR